MSSVRIILFVVILLFSSGFKYKVKESGYVNSRQNVQVGFIKDQVRSAMGNPSVISDLTDKWYYIGTTVSKDFLGLKKEFTANVVEISFKNDIVRYIKSDVISKRPLPKVNSDSNVINKESLKTKFINAFKRLNPSL